MTMQGESSTGAHQNLAGVAEACRAHDTVSPTAVFLESINLIKGSTEGPFCKVFTEHQQHLIALALRTEGIGNKISPLCRRFLSWILCALWALYPSMAMHGE